MINSDHVAETNKNQTSDTENIVYINCTSRFRTGKSGYKYKQIKIIVQQLQPFSQKLEHSSKKIQIQAVNLQVLQYW